MPLAAAIAEIEAGRKTTPLIGEPTGGGDGPVTFVARRLGDHVPRIVDLIACGLTGDQFGPHNPRQSAAPQFGAIRASEFVTPASEGDPCPADAPVSAFLAGELPTWMASRYGVTRSAAAPVADHDGDLRHLDDLLPSPAGGPDPLCARNVPLSLREAGADGPLRTPHVDLRQRDEPAVDTRALKRRVPTAPRVNRVPHVTNRERGASRASLYVSVLGFRYNTSMDAGTPGSRASRLVVRRFASAVEADRHELEYWMAMPASERLRQVWRLSVELWRWKGGDPDEPGLRRSVASVRRP